MKRKTMMRGHYIEGLWSGDVPLRPDWVNLYLADKNGKKMNEGRQLDGEIFIKMEEAPCESLPSSFQLFQNTPNPFNPITTIRFNLPQVSHIRMNVFNVLGQRIKTLYDGQKSAGNHLIQWDGKDDLGIHAASGVYFCEWVAGDRMQVMKMFLVR